MSSLHPLNRPFGAIGHDYEQVDVAVVVRFAPSVRAKKNDFLGLELGHQPADHFVENALFYNLHGTKADVPSAAKRP